MADRALGASILRMATSVPHRRSCVTPVDKSATSNAHAKGTLISFIDIDLTPFPSISRKSTNASPDRLLLMAVVIIIV